MSGQPDSSEAQPEPPAVDSPVPDGAFNDTASDAQHDSARRAQVGQQAAVSISRSHLSQCLYCSLLLIQGVPLSACHLQCLCTIVPSPDT